MGSAFRLTRVVAALPAWTLYVLFFLVPLSIIVAYSFGYKPAPDDPAIIGLDRLSLDNYRAVTSGLLGDVLFATVQTAATGTLLCLIIGYPVAYFLATRVSERRKPLLLMLVVVPFWTSFLLRTFAWRILLSGNGPVSTALQAVGLLGEPLRVLDTRAAVQLGVVYNYLPLMVLPIFVAVDRLDATLREASQDLGAGRWRTFVNITWPLSAPGVVSGVLLVFIPLAGEYVTPTILGGARGAMAGSLVASQFLEAQNWALGSAEAVVLVLAILGVVSGCALVLAAVRSARRLRQRDLIQQSVA